MQYEITKTKAMKEGSGISVTVIEDGDDERLNQHNFGADWLEEDKDGIPRWKHHLDRHYANMDAEKTAVERHCNGCAKKFIGKHDPKIADLDKK